MANTAPFACEISVNGPFDRTLPRNTFRQPGTYYQDTALLKNIPLPKEGMKLQVRGEFYNLFNHPNLYINGGTNDVNASPFTRRDGQTVPGVTANFGDNRQIVFSLAPMCSSWRPPYAAMEIRSMELSAFQAAPRNTIIAENSIQTIKPNTAASPP
jgi:hypothetical protein